MTKKDSVLRFTTKDEERYIDSTTIRRVTPPEKVMPEYFLLIVNKFNAVAKTPIEEWMQYLKDAAIREDTTTPGLQAAREKLAYMSMSPGERRAYEDYMVSVHAFRDAWETSIYDAKAEGRAEGLAEGLAEGIEKGRFDANLENARRMKADGMPAELIAKYTGLTEEQINAL